MPSIVKTLRVVADPNRLRILLLLKGEQLSVAELQEILGLGQSTISTHLSQLKQAGLVDDRRTGKSSLYRLLDQAPDKDAVLKGHDLSRAINASTKDRALAPEGSTLLPTTPQDDNFLDNLLVRASREIPESAADQSARRRVVRKRQDKMRTFFDTVAGRLGKNYVPGKSWKSMAEALLRLMPPMVIADLGTGEGSFALLLSQRAKKVIAVDTSARMIEVGREQAQRNGIRNIDFRLGDMEELPIADGEVELAFFSQSLHHALHPQQAIEETWRILAPGGRIVILDLVKHRFEEAREVYADEWLGFSEAELESMLQKAGFKNVETSVVDKESEGPQFQTVLALAHKPVR